MGNAMNDPFENRAAVEPENFPGETAHTRKTKNEPKKHHYD
jgi:hypothetical protein